MGSPTVDRWEILKKYFANHVVRHERNTVRGSFSFKRWLHELALRRGRALCLRFSYKHLLVAEES